MKNWFVMLSRLKIHIILVLDRIYAVRSMGNLYSSNNWIKHNIQIQKQGINKSQRHTTVRSI